MSYDVVIVGAGIAGLTCGIALAKQKKKVCILEKYAYTGGRVVTYNKNGYHWENGAGRISNKHKRVHALLKKYGLSTIPLSEEQLFIPKGSTEEDARPNTFESQFAAILQTIRKMPPGILATHTLEELCRGILGETQSIRLFHQFAYRAEVSVMRADVAMEAFLGKGEMGSYEGYSVCKEGLSALIDAMVKEFEDLGGEILMRHEMISLSEGENVCVVCKVGSKETGFVTKEIVGSKCILALHSAALKECSSTRHFPVLKHLMMCPLLRTYGVFPTKKGQSWFSGLPRVVTGNPVRYFIPINPSAGVAMVSYTDADDAWRFIQYEEKHGEKALGKLILKELREMFPGREIPDYTFFKAHPWTHGCTYWTPGDYDVVAESKKALRPDPKQFPSVYMCGESFSLRQAWMEGAIEHAELLLKTHFKQKN